LATKEETRHVDGHHIVKLVSAQLPQGRRPASDAGVVDEDVRWADLDPHLGDGPRHVILARDVAGHSQAVKRASDSRCRFKVAVEDGDTGSRGGEALADGAADAL